VTSFEGPTYPITVVRTRYGGIYEPGEWVAFPLAPQDMPQDWNAEDLRCASFWFEFRGVVGAGASPGEAYDDLVEQYRKGRH